MPPVIFRAFPPARASTQSLRVELRFGFTDRKTSENRQLTLPRCRLSQFDVSGFLGSDASATVRAGRFVGMRVSKQTLRRKAGRDEAQTQAAIVSVLKSISEPRRYRIFASIARMGELSCAEIVRQEAVTHGNITHHLQHLADAGLIEIKREGRFCRAIFIRAAWSEFVSSLTSQTSPE